MRDNRAIEVLLSNWRVSHLPKAAFRFRGEILLKACTVTVVVAVLLLWPQHAAAQRLELNGGYEHVSGDLGLNGFDAGVAYWFTQRVSLAANYDGVYNNSNVGVFDLTNIGAILVSSHAQNFLVGPRIFFRAWNVNQHVFHPFAEFQFGMTHLNSTVQEVPMPSVSASDTAFAWMAGVGADYRLNRHWSVRTNLDFLRTHLNSEGQSRWRFGVGVAYSFGAHHDEQAPKPIHPHT
jgi:long-subunit fatty acid transport protein